MTCNIETISFNDDHTRFIVGSKDGFLVYETDPCQYKFSRHTYEGGLCIVKVFSRSGIVVFVGTGKNIEYPKNKAYIWDDPKEKIITWIECTEDIMEIIPQDPLLVILTNNVATVFHLQIGLKQLPSHEIDNDTYDCVLVKNIGNKPTLIYPSSKDIGKIIIQTYNWDDKELVESAILTISAHDNKIKKTAINSDGTLLMTSSIKGTIIRIFDTSNGNCIQVVRRGINSASIIDCCFCSKSEYITVVSDTSTLHLYSLNTTNKDKPENTKSSLSFIPNMFLPSYFTSEWSFASTTLEQEWINSGIIVTFGLTNNNIIIIIKNGKYVRYTFNPIIKTIEKDKEDYWYLL